MKDFLVFHRRQPAEVRRLAIPPGAEEGVVCPFTESSDFRALT